MLPSFLGGSHLAAVNLHRSMAGQVILKRASASRPSGEWSDDYDVLADGVVVGQHHERRRLTHRLAVDVDATLRLPRRPLADARLRSDARGGDGGVREKLAAGMSGAGQAEQATRQRWPPPAPRLRRLLRCHPAGWQSGRGGLSTGVYSGRGDRGEAATTTISNRPRELFVICGQVRPVATSRVLINAQIAAPAFF
jgi:hypothetical protein